MLYVLHVPKTGETFRFSHSEIEDYKYFAQKAGFNEFELSISYDGGKTWEKLPNIAKQQVFAE